jgi:hypothetical protein
LVHDQVARFAEAQNCVQAWNYDLGGLNVLVFRPEVVRCDLALLRDLVSQSAPASRCGLVDRCVPGVSLGLGARHGPGARLDLA